MPDHRHRPDRPPVLFVCVRNGGKPQMVAGRMRLVRDDIAARVRALAAQLGGSPST